MNAQDNDEATVKADNVTWSPVTTPNNLRVMWPTMLQPYIRSTQVFNCASVSGAKAYVNGQSPSPDTGWSLDNIMGSSYAINNVTENVNAWNSSYPDWSNPTGKSMSQIQDTAGTVLFLDYAATTWTYAMTSQNGMTSNTPQMVKQLPPDTNDVYRHNEMASAGFCDGHVKSMRQGDLTATHAVPLRSGGTANLPYMWSIQAD